MLIHLIEEMLDKVLDYCSLQDMKNFSLTNSEYNKLFRRYIFQGAVAVPEQELRDGNGFAERIELFHGIFCLRLHARNYCIKEHVFKGISSLYYLQELDLSGTCTSGLDEGLNYLSQGLSQLEVLNLSFTNISSLGCSYLPSFCMLHRLILMNCSHLDDKGMWYITQITTLKSLNVANTGVREGKIVRNLTVCNKERNFNRICAKGFSYLENLRELEELNLNHCRIGDNRLVGVSQLLKLQMLDLSGCLGDISDNELHTICELRSLRILDLSCCVDITDAGFSGLGSLCKLETLKLASCNIGDVGFAAVCHLSNLKVLDLESCRTITDFGFFEIVNLCELKELILRKCGIGSIGFPAVCQLKKLEALDISSCLNLPDLSFSLGIASLAELKSLKLSKCKIADGGFFAVCTLLKLHTLDVSYCHLITDDAFYDMSSLKELKELKVKDCDINDALFCEIFTLFDLEILDISYCKNMSGRTDAGFLSLSAFVGLEQLSIMGCSIDDSAFIAVGELKSLRMLDISACANITDEGFCYIGNLTKLDTLKMSRCNVSDVGFTCSCQLLNLKRLDVRYCRNLSKGELYRTARLLRLEELLVN